MFSLIAFCKYYNIQYFQTVENPSLINFFELNLILQVNLLAQT